MKTYKSKNVADLDKVVQICGAIGDNYKPSNEALMPAALVSLLVAVDEKVKAANSAHRVATLLAKERLLVFDGIPTLATRIVRMVASSGASVAEQMLAREIKRKYFGQSGRSHATAVDQPEVAKSTAQKKSPRTNFRDYASQLAGFAELVQLVSGIPGYKPLETALQPDTLHKLLADLQSLHVATIEAKLGLVKARDERNQIVEETVAGTVKAVKSYMRASLPNDATMLKQL